MASNNRREITIVLTGDAKGLTGTVKVIDAEMKKLGGSFDVVGEKARGSGRAIDDAGKQIEASNRRTAAAIGLVVSAAVVGFSALVKHQLDVADSTGKMAQRLGVSTEFLSSMGYAAKSAGADTQVLDTSLQSLAESQLKAAGGNKQYAAAFAALGINIRTARGELKPLADMLPEIAERFRTMPDGANKAALAAKLFGAEGAKLIPMLNQGKEGLAAMSEEAAKLGLVLDQQTVDSATELNDQLERIKNLTTGAANTFLREMLPAVQAITGGMGDASTEGDRMSEMAEVLANALKGLAVGAYAVVVAVKAVATAVAAAVINMGIGLRAVGTDTSLFFSSARTAIMQAGTLDVKGVFNTWSAAAGAMVTNNEKAFADMKANGGQFVGDMKSLWGDLADFTGKLFPSEEAKWKANLDASTAALYKEMDRLKATRNTPKVKDDWDGRISNLRKAAKAALPDLTNLANMVDKLQGKAGTPIDEANAQYITTIRELAAKAAAEITKADEAVKKGHMSVADAAKVEASAQELVTKGITAASAARDESIEKIKRQMDVAGRLIEQIEQEAHLAGLSERDQAIMRASMAYEQEAREQNLHLTLEQTAAEKQRVEAAAAASFDMQRIAEQQRQIAQEYAGFWENAAGSISKAFGDLITRQTRSWKDFGRSLKSIAQQFVSDIISQFIRLRILGPLMSGAMGTVAGWLGIAGSLSGSSLSYSPNYAGGGGTIGSAPGAVGGGAGGAAGGGYAGMLSNISSMRSAYQWASTGGIWGSPAVAGTSTAGTGVYGVNMPGGQVVYGNGAISAPPGPYGGSFTAGGYGVPYASIGGGLLGAYYGSQRGGGGFSTVASTVSYGALGAGIAGTAAGVAGGASLGAAAGGAFGAAAGMSWIPVVGWVLAAMALVDMVSGGKLFGTKYQTAASDATLRIGAEGGEASASLYQTKQRALFGGRKTRVVDQAVPQEMQDAADALYNSIAKSMVQGAQKLGVDVPAMIEASLNTHTTYNDKGQVRATEYVVNYLGQTWKEATAEAAAQRIGAEALVATVAASAGAVAQTIAEQWRKSADTLLDGAQTMLAAQVDINKGNSLIALGATATLSQVIKFVQGMQADGEKLADTYARVAAASAQYVQFVAQFAPVSAGFGASLQAINKQMQANLDQANALAQAAGMQHAAESDLANIHEFAAKQAADAIMQLSAAAQDLAAKLYNVTTNTLASVSAQIDKLQGKVQTAAQLAIGDNSPLSGKEKLDVALQGLRSGITSADDVLALGRKLYSSSADYAGLFAKVSEILQLPGATGQQSLTDAMTGYNALIGQRDQLAAQAAASQRFGDAKTLAQYVADISTTHGISYGEAASGLGFSLNDLAKDLGLTNISGYLDSLEQQDVAGTTLTASANIVDAVRGIGHDIVQAILGGPLVQPGPVTTTAKQGPTEDQAALLAKLSAQVDVLIQHAESTAQSNGKMLDLDKSGRLRDVTNSTRSATV